MWRVCTVWDACSAGWCCRIMGSGQWGSMQGKSTGWMESGGDEASKSGEQWDLLASRFVKGNYCAYSFILTVVIAGIGQLIATLVLEPCRAAARHRSDVSTVGSEIRAKN